MRTRYTATVKQYVLKEDVSITFTPEEIWELILICEGNKSYCNDAMNSYPKGSTGYNEYKRLMEIPERMQKKIMDVRKQYGVLEDVWL